MSPVFWELLLALLVIGFLLFDLYRMKRQDRKEKEQARRGED